MAFGKYWSAHSHSKFSVDDALSSVPDMVARAVELDYPALGLTDHGTMAGCSQLYKSGKAAGLPVLPGIEMYLTAVHEARQQRSMHLTMWSYTGQGYRNLVALANQAHRQFYYRPRLDMADLAVAAEQGLTAGIAVGTGCRSGPVVRSLTERGDAAGAIGIVNALAGWFPHVYVELMEHGFSVDGMSDTEICTELAGIAKRTGLPMILTGDSHYVHAADSEAHNALKMLVTFSKDPAEGIFSGSGYHLLSDAEATDKLPFGQYDVLEGLDSLAKIAKVVIPELDTFSLKIPDVTLKGQQDMVLAEQATKALEQLLDGFAQTGKLSAAKRKRYNSRLQSELDVISDTGMAGYLLLVALITDFMTERGIWFHTRGSAAGSLVCYCRGITQADPLVWEIRMDRFLSGDRASVPDVDLDIEHTRRDEVVAHLQSLGYELVQVGTQPVYGLDVKGEEEGAEERGSLRVKYFSVLRKQGQAFTTWADAPAEDKATLAMLASRQLIAGVGAHPGGYIVARDAPTVACLPLVRIDSSGTMVTAWDKGEVEAAGFPKIDLLGSKALTAMRLTCELVVSDNTWFLPDEALLYYRSIPLDDKAAIARAGSGQTAGLFQLGGWAQRRGLEDLKPHKTADLVAAQALFRPAPLQSGFTKSYLRRRDGYDKVPVMHPDIKAETADTYGLPLYQEQVVGLLRRIGVQSVQLTKMLKAVKSSGRAGEAAAKIAVAQEIESISALATSHGWSTSDVAYLERALLDYGAGYSFGKAHSVTYGLVAYWSAYLAAHEPLAYWTGMLNAYMGSKNAKGKSFEPVLARAAKSDNIRVKNPHVLHSQLGYVADPAQGVILKGLVSIGGVGKVAARELVAKRPYSSLVDLGLRVSGKVSGAKDLALGTPPSECGGVIAALSAVHALDGIPPGTPIRRALGRIRRCQICKTTFPTALDYEIHAETEHQEEK